MRVQIPAYTDRWMMGDRYGEVVRTYYRKGDITRHANGARIAALVEMATVKLDSGKTVRVILDDCKLL